MLGILCEYMRSDYDSMIKRLCTFFPIGCKCSVQYTDLDTQNGTDKVASILTQCFFAIDYDQFHERQNLFHHLNHRLKDSSIITKEIECLEINNEIISFEVSSLEIFCKKCISWMQIILFFQNEGYIHFNKSSKSIEYWFSYNNMNLKAEIRPLKVHTIVIKELV